MKDIPLVSIIINNYNYGRFLCSAIDSALNQTYSNTEVIVVDDGSTDNSREFITSYGKQIIPVLKENGGQASAFNAGFAASSGEIICLLDSDDIFLPEKVAKVVNVFENYQDIGWCFHSLNLVNVTTGASLKVNNEYPSGEYDIRPQLKRGKKPFQPPATSGLCFKSSLLQMILPMPEEIAITSDNYLKLTASALSKGFFINEELTLQRWHGDNAYTFRADKQQLKARISILTAYWTRAKLPEFTTFTNKVFAQGLGIYWRTGGVEAESKNVIKLYLANLSLIEKTKIGLRAIFYSLKV